LKKKLSLFMAVPTIYTRLAQQWEKAGAKERSAFSKAAKKMRLFVSGSSALPTPIFKTWEEITSHRILERYGMSEIGMALSNPYAGERRPGTVGKPLPGVDVRIVSEEEDDEGGELWVKSPAMFREYWQKQEATEKSFEDGWFKTGDVVAEENGYFKILGRTSVDIIKSGGFKISALEVESVLMGHNSIEEVAVVGVEDPVWGERVGAAIVEADNADITPGWLKGWAGEFLAPYKLPTVLVKLNSLPRNAMGKVNKTEIKELISREMELERS
jgi:malonyl-CoA/methylmalonyl-CoA synthetase